MLAIRLIFHDYLLTRAREHGQVIRKSPYSHRLHSNFSTKYEGRRPIVSFVFMNANIDNNTNLILYAYAIPSRMIKDEYELEIDVGMIFG